MSEERAPTEEAETQAATPSALVFCQVCGKSQSAGERYCRWCGAYLQAMTGRGGRSPIDPAAGRNKEGIGIILFLLNIITFHYYSKYWGTVAMVFSTLIWAWGRAENFRANRVRPTDSPEVIAAKRLLRLKITRQGLGFLLFMTGAFVFYKYHRMVGGVIGGIGIAIGFYDLWRTFPSLLLRRR